MSSLQYELETEINKHHKTRLMYESEREKRRELEKEILSLNETLREEQLKYDKKLEEYRQLEKKFENYREQIIRERKGWENERQSLLENKQSSIFGQSTAVDKLNALKEINRKKSPGYLKLQAKLKSEEEEREREQRRNQIIEEQKLIREDLQYRLRRYSDKTIADIKLKQE